MSTTSSGSEDDAAHAAFREVAMQAELAAQQVLQRRDTSSKAASSSAPNPNLAEALNRIIDGSLVFKEACCSVGATSGESKRSATSRGELAGGQGVRLFRKGPTVSKVDQKRKYLTPRRTVVTNSLPKHRLIDIDAVFGSDSDVSLKGVVTAGQPLVDSLEIWRQRTRNSRNSGEKIKDHHAHQAPKTGETGIVVEPVRSKARLRQLKRTMVDPERIFT